MTVSKTLQRMFALLPLMALLAFTTSGLAATASPGLTISAFAEPTHFEVGHEARTR